MPQGLVRVIEVAVMVAMAVVSVVVMTEVILRYTLGEDPGRDRGAVAVPDGLDRVPGLCLVNA